MRRTERFILLSIVCLIASYCICQRADAQVIAYAGESFGVGQLTTRVATDASMLASVTDGFTLVETGGRVFYPVFTQGRFRRLLGEILGTGGQTTSDRLTVYFLFRGDAPLEITLYTPEPQTFHVTPRAAVNLRVSGRLRMQWWRAYDAQARSRSIKATTSRWSRRT